MAMSEIEPCPRDDTEALAALVHLAGRKTLPIPPELLARHTLHLHKTWEWPVRRAAFEALLRRLASARSEEIAVLEAPPRRGRRPPRWHLGRPDVEGVLPYDVRLSSVEPLEGRCDCADFTRSTLGLCKHLLAVVDALFRGRGSLARSPSVVTTAWHLVWSFGFVDHDPRDLLGGVSLAPPRER